MLRNIRYYSPFLILAVSLAMPSCVNDDDGPKATVDSPYIICGMPERMPVSEWRQDVTARADDPYTPVAELPADIGVYGYNDASAQSVFKNRQMFSYYDKGYDGFDQVFPDNNNLWPYYNPVSWVGGANYKFGAYAPYSEDVMAQGESFANFNTLVFPKVPYYSAQELLAANTIVEYKAKAAGNDVQLFTLTHLLARLRFCFKLGPKYAELRIIHITEIEVTKPNGNTFTLFVRYSKADETSPYRPTFEWVQNNDLVPDTDPVSVTLDKSVDGVYDIVSCGKECLELSAETNDRFRPYGSMYACTFPNAYVRDLHIKVTYDVYDRTGQLLREADQVSNTINLKAQYDLKPGYYYDINLVVEPTFLYVLSDNDPDPQAHGYLVINDNR